MRRSKQQQRSKQAADQQLQPIPVGALCTLKCTTWIDSKIHAPVILGSPSSGQLSANIGFVAQRDTTVLVVAYVKDKYGCVVMQLLCGDRIGFLPCPHRDKPRYEADNVIRYFNNALRRIT